MNCKKSNSLVNFQFKYSSLEKNFYFLQIFFLKLQYFYFILRLLDDSLKCSADIIDGDCSKANGTDKFDSWYKGLRAVYSYMCSTASTDGKLRKSSLNSEFLCF